MATMVVKNASGGNETVEKPLAPARAAAAASRPVVLSTEDLAVLTALSAKLPAALGVAAGSASLSVATAKDEIRFVDVTLSLDTAIYAASDVLADTQVVTGALKAADAVGTLHSVSVIDEDDQGAALTLLFFDANSALGTENAAASITDAASRAFLGFVDIATGDYKDLGGVKVAFKGSIGMAIKAATGTANIYVAALNGAGTPTYTASGVKLRLGFLG